MALLSRSHISYCYGFNGVLFIFTAWLSKSNADWRKSCHYYCILRLFLCQPLAVLGFSAPSLHLFPVVID